MHEKRVFSNTVFISDRGGAEHIEDFGSALDIQDSWIIFEFRIFRMAGAVICQKA